MNQELFEAIMGGKRKIVKQIVEDAIANNEDVIDLMNTSMIPAMREIGEKFSRNEAYVPEMLIAARAMAAGLTLIEPILEASGHEPRGKVVVGTVKGDLHDIGKNLVVMMLKGAGYEVVDAGVDCDPEKFIEAVDNQGAKAILLSALLTTTMPAMKDVIAKLEGRDVKVIIGGAPVTQEYADEIGAHGYGSDANEAVKVTDTCLGLTA